MDQKAKDLFLIRNKRRVYTIVLRTKSCSLDKNGAQYLLTVLAPASEKLKKTFSDKGSYSW